MRVARLLPVLAAAVALVTAGGAGAAPTKAYNVTFKGTVQTDWNLPKYKPYETCFDTFWKEGRGSETWNVRSKGAQKVLAYQLGTTPWLQVGSWTLGDTKARSSLDAKGEVARSGGFVSTVTAGTCGVGPAHPAEPVPDDCGTRLVNYDVSLNLNKGELTPDVLLGENGVREKTGFDTCTLVAPPNVTPGSWPAASGKLPTAKLLGARKAFTVKGHDSWTGEVPPSKGSTTTTIDWQLTFTPAKKAGRRR